MKHRIGQNYSRILKTRKDKRQLPLVGRLKLRCDIEKLQAEIGGLLGRYKSFIENGDFTLDPASSEHNYHLKDRAGQSFIQNYDEFYRNYSVVGFQELSADARALADSLDFKMESLSPGARLKGMKDTAYSRYHPHYDERNYTARTQFCTPEVTRVLDSFSAEPCRSALVVLHPGRFISPHFDIGPEYITRAMIPIFTNPLARVGVRSSVDGEPGYREFHLPADGHIYFINSGFEHYATNLGTESRYQIRICLNGQQDLQDLEPLEPVRFLPDDDFQAHLPAAQNILKDTLEEFNLSKSGQAVLT